MNPNTPLSTKFPCRRCLMNGVEESKIKATIETYLQSLPPEALTTQEEYSHRLQICDTCPNLSNGLCTLCGCFVLYRAGICKEHCPDVSDHWK